jgi:hypothetical protein
LVKFPTLFSIRKIEPGFHIFGNLIEKLGLNRKLPKINVFSKIDDESIASGIIILKIERNSKLIIPKIMKLTL